MVYRIWFTVCRLEDKVAHMYGIIGRLEADSEVVADQLSGLIVAPPPPPAVVGGGGAGGRGAGGGGGGGRV